MMLQPKYHRLAIVLLGVLLGIVLGAEHASAQFRGRGPGGGFRSFGFGRFGGRGVSLFGALGRDEVRAELKLTEEQQKKIEELSDRSRPDRNASQPFYDRMRAANTEEERDAISAEMQLAFDKRRKEAEAELKNVLSPEQHARLVQLALQRAGTRALGQDEIAAELKLDDKQKEQIKKLLEDRDQAFRDNSVYRAPQEERDKFEADWDAKVLAVLSQEQSQSWQTKLGSPPQADSDAEPSSNAAQTAESAPSAEPEPEGDESAPAVAETPSETDGEAEETVVASFNSVEPQGEKALSPKTQQPDPTVAPVPGSETGQEPEQPTPAPATQNELERPAKPERLSFNFRYAPWSDVLKLFADAADLTLDLNDVPPGTFNYYDSGTYTPTQALDILNGYLLQKGYILVRRDRFLVSLNIDNGIPPNLVPTVTVEELPQRGRNELLSVILPLEGIKAEDAAKEAEALLGPQGKGVAMTTSNSLVLTDIGSNLMRIHQLFKTATVKSDPEALSFRAFPLKHIPASDAEEIVRDLLGLSRSVQNVSTGSYYGRSSSSRYGYRYDPRYGGGSSSRGPSPPQQGTSSEQTKTHVAVDPRTNSLLVTATASQLQIVEEAVRVIDVGEDESGRPLVALNNKPQLKVYDVQTANPTEVTKTLGALMPHVVVNEDDRARKIHILATPAEHEEVERLIRQLDGQGGGQTVSVVSLARLDPVAAAGMLRSLFAADGDNAPTIETDIVGRRLMVRGTADQLAQVKTLLAQLGEDGSGSYADNSQHRGPVRTYSLGGRDPQEFLRLLEKSWSVSNPNPIRVVIPSQSNPIRDQAIPSEEETGEGKKAASEERPIGLTGTMPISIVSQTAPGDAADESAQPETRPEQEPPAERGAKAAITISISEGNLVIASSDLEALDRMERLIEMLAMTMRAKTTWTVFYLRTADAIQTATMLEQLFPSSSVSAGAGEESSGLLGSLTGGISSFGRSLGDLTGLSELGVGPQTLRIIPEARSNSLFVAGPPDKIREVEQVLKILDASELPESLRDRVPRTIPVEHADVNDVAAIVKDVYKDYMEEQRTAGSGANPIAMLMGATSGNRGGNQQRGQPAGPIRLTLGVDTRTNQLVVSSSEALFKQIEALVEYLDQAAYEAQQTVRVVRLDNTEAVSVQQTLSSLIPKVKISVTGGAKPQVQPSGGTPSSSSAGSVPQVQTRPGPEDMRRFFEQRMRERMEQMRRGGSSSDGRGRPSFGSGGRSSRRGGGR